MQNKATGHQSINCHVDSCAYNDKQACTCTLSAIDVKPCCDCHDGKAENETNCPVCLCQSSMFFTQQMIVSGSKPSAEYGYQMPVCR